MRLITTLLSLGLLMLLGAFLMGCGEENNTPPPSIFSLTPSSGTSGVSVSILGGHLTGATSVKFNGVEASSFQIGSDLVITAVVPVGATTGKITITTPQGTCESGSDFTVTVPQQPQITSFDPTSGSNAGGATVTITGSHFTGATAVKFNNTAADSFTVVSDTQISAVTPVGVTSGKISVTTSQGTGESQDDFTIGPIPQITEFTPTSGSFIGGTTVTITGSHFTGATAVTFGGIPATSFTVDSDTQITAITGPTVFGPCTITVETGTGIGTSTGYFTFDPPIG